MGDSSAQIASGVGFSVDTRTMSGGDHREVVVIGDPSTANGVAPVDGTTGLKVDLGTDNDVTVTSGTVIVSSVTPGVTATSLGKHEDSAHTSSDVGVMLLAVRNDAGSVLAGTTGDYIPLNTNSSGDLRVVTSNTTTTDRSTFTASSTSGNIVMGAYQATPDTLTDGQAAAALLDVNRRLVVKEGFSPVAEDNVAGVMGTILKPINSATYAPLVTDNTFATRVTKKLTKPSAGNVYAVQVFNFGTTLAYFQLFNKATAPSAGDTQVAGCSWPVRAGNPTSPGSLFLTPEDFAPTNRHETGIGWALSSTLNTFTDALTATDFVVSLRYV